jgi:hypothetical protein
VPDGEAQVHEIVRRLRSVRISTITVGIVSAVLLGGAGLGGAWLVISVLDMGFGLAGVFLRIIAVLLLLGVLSGIAYRLLRVFSVSHSIKAYAARVGGDLKELGLDLLTALELSQVDSGRLGYSNVLILRVIDDIGRKVRGFDLQVGVRKRAALGFLIPVVMLLAGGILWWSYDPSSLAYSLKRLSFFWGLTGESGISIAVRPGDDELLAGEDLEITAEVRGFTRRVPAVHVISGAEETAFAMDRPEPGDTRGLARFTSRLTRVDRDLSYFVTLGDEQTRIYRISVHEEPRIKGGTVRLLYPTYTGRGEELLPQGIWDFTAPYGTRALMTFIANCSPGSAWVSLVDTAGLAVELPVEIAGDSLTFDQVLLSGFTYEVHIEAGDEAVAKPHGPYTVTVTRDQPPYVRIESPDSEIMLEADMMIPLSVVALDDYGISIINLVYQCPADSSAVTLPYKGKTQARSDYSWDVGSLDLFPGDAITYYVEVADNDALTGPKHARTDLYVARIPTLYDVYREIEYQQTEDIEALEEIADEAEELKEEFEDLAEDMKRKSDMDWEEEQAVKQSIAKQDELRERLEEVASSIDETLDMMNESSIVDFEVIEKMEEIRRLLDEVATQEMMEAIEKMQQAMENLSPEEIRSAMENLSMTQEDLLRRLDSTIDMLKRLQLQQRMESVANLAGRISEEQQELNQSMSEGSDLKEAATRQQGLLNDTGTLEQMMQELAEMMNAEGNPLAETIEEAGEFLESSQVQQSMSMAQASMSSGMRESAMEHGEKAGQTMEELAGMLQQARDMLMGEERRQIVEALTAAMHALRDVSTRQEDVLEKIGQPPDEVPTSELARMEMVYKEALDRIAEDLFEISKKSLFVSPMLGRSVLRLGTQMESVSNLLAQGIRGRARKDVKSALGSVNQLITGLMDATQQASSCSSPSGLSEAFQNLDNMCCMQMGINQGTQGLLNLGEQGLSMEARAEMARLAAEQEAVRKGIEDLAGEFGGRNEILGRLDDLADEARRVIEDLQRENVDRETLRRQERILTRLLNAQKSMRRRDYSKRRKSRPGEEYVIESPPELSLDQREQMIHDLLYQKRGYYPPEYEDLIRAYFRAIAETRVNQ